jgi:hypothetical protein
MPQEQGVPRTSLHPWSNRPLFQYAPLQEESEAKATGLYFRNAPLQGGINRQKTHIENRKEKPTMTPTDVTGKNCKLTRAAILLFKTPHPLLGKVLFGKCVLQIRYKLVKRFTFIKYDPKDCFSILHSFQWCSSANLEKLQVGWCFVHQEAATFAILVSTQLLDWLHYR